MTLTILWSTATALLILSALLATYRLIAGPRNLDRMISLDMISAIAQCSIAAFIAITGNVAPAPILVSLALLGFIAAATVARFRPVLDPDVEEQT